jgi:hypothetical protein
MIYIVSFRTALMISLAVLALGFWAGSDQYQECSANGGSVLGRGDYVCSP